MTRKEKVALGQFFTKEYFWLKPQVVQFIVNSKASVAYDPFAGGGDMLFAVQNRLNFNIIKGLDIDVAQKWDINDSLKFIPHVQDAIIITNPPYLAKQSASRKKIDFSEYFNNSIYDDIYLIALDKILDAQDYAVVIIPESFINSSFKRKNRLKSITILEENPFTDTENPVCVACFDNREKSFDEIQIFKNDRFVNSFQNIEDIRLAPTNSVKIKFNDPTGWLGLRAIDSTDDKTFIKFDFRQNIHYDWANRLKYSSRHMTLIEIDIPAKHRKVFIDKCNELTDEIREDSMDILLTPFKGNTKRGKRRRRLDFRLARAIMEHVYNNIQGKPTYEQQRIF